MRKITKSQESVITYILGFLFLVFFILSFSRVLYWDQDFDWSSKVEHKTIPTNYRLLDGKPVAEDRISLKPVVVILENHFV